MDNFNLKKFLVENKLTYNSKLINEEQALIAYILYKYWFIMSNILNEKCQNLNFNNK